MRLRHADPWTNPHDFHTSIRPHIYLAFVGLRLAEEYKGKCKEIGELLGNLKQLKGITPKQMQQFQWEAMTLWLMECTTGGKNLMNHQQWCRWAWSWKGNWLQVNTNRACTVGEKHHTQRYLSGSCGLNGKLTSKTGLKHASSTRRERHYGIMDPWTALLVITCVSKWEWTYPIWPKRRMGMSYRW